MHFNECSICTKCQLDRGIHSLFMAEKCKKCEMKKKQIDIKDLLTRLACAICFKISTSWAISAANSDKRSQSYTCVKITSLSSCQYTHGMVHWLLGPHGSVS